MFDDLLLLQKGGWTAYVGPLGPGGRAMVAYMQSLPGVPRCPRRMNPSSWMLDSLSGSDSSGGGAGGEHGGDAAAAAAAATAAAAHGHATAAHPGTPLPDSESPAAAAAAAAVDSAAAVGIPGPLLRERLLASKVWAAADAELAALATPAPGSAPYTFASVYARSTGWQLAALLGRTWTMYWRDVSYNFTRWTALLALMLLFGTIWHKLTPDTQGGVQSIVSVIFFSSL